MERLIHSSQIPTKLNHLKPHHHHHHHLPQLGRVTTVRLGPTTESRRVNSSFSLKVNRFQSRVHCNSTQIEESLVISPGFSSNSDFSVEKSSDVQTHVQKALALGKLVLLSTLALTVVNATLPQPAFASFQTATKTGGAGLLRTELLNSAWTGFFAGCLHTLSGPDHLAALAPLSIGCSRMESALVGALWGCGHDAGQLIFGLLFLVLKDRLQIEVFRTWGSIVVGVTLMVIGAMGIKEASEIPASSIALETGDFNVPLVERKKKTGFATFATGVVHGLQPDALIIILPALALPSRLAGAAFLGMFLVGTVVAMGGYTVFIGSCSEALKERVPRITEKLTWASSLVAIGLGLSLLISQFFGFSLY